jgi:hypothetical protein
MKIDIILKRNPFDSRYGICRFVCTRFKISISLYPFLYRWEPHWKEYFLTVLFVNIHYKSSEA